MGPGPWVPQWHVQPCPHSLVHCPDLQAPTCRDTPLGFAQHPLDLRWTGLLWMPTLAHTWPGWDSAIKKTQPLWASLALARLDSAIKKMNLAKT